MLGGQASLRDRGRDLRWLGLLCCESSYKRHGGRFSKAPGSRKEELDSSSSSGAAITRDSTVNIVTLHKFQCAG